MSTVIHPESLGALTEAVRSVPRLHPTGAGTKPRLVATEATRLDLTRLRGILEYDPGEFTFTALAGTPVREVVAALAEKGQYLPFDPVHVEAGSTIGGLIASGISGPGRLRYGGVRDFILGVRMVDGTGRLLRFGGKVVKNAAGFDVPKFLVGSLGRFGVIAEATFKVFPRPEARRTLRLAVSSLSAALEVADVLGRSRFDPEAIDLLPDDGGLLVRLAGPEAALEALAADLLQRHLGERLSEVVASAHWHRLNEFTWRSAGDALCKIPCHRAGVVALDRALRETGARVHWSAAFNVAFVSLPSPVGDGGALEHLSGLLTGWGLTALTLDGQAPLLWGARPEQRIERAVKHALDPDDRFPGLST
jgi:glycolate oxidase FAD binding subunit